MAKTRVNWHEAVVCAIKIDLRDYAQYLEYYSEYVLGKNNYRMDLLVVKNLSREKLPKKIAHLFSTFNIFEIKGIGSSVTPDSYYKVNGYAGHFIDITGKRNQYSREDVTITFLSRRIPKKLFHHLEEMHEKYQADYQNDCRMNCKNTIEKYAPGIYYIHREMYRTQVIVTSELSSVENLYLRCLTNQLTEEDTPLVEELVKDYQKNQEQTEYLKYMNYLAKANTKGDSPMVCEGILELCGTSSKEIAERQRKEDAAYYEPIIQQQKEEFQRQKEVFQRQKEVFQQQKIENAALLKEVEQLRKMLATHGVVQQ